MLLYSVISSLETAFETGDVNVVSAAKHLDRVNPRVTQLEPCYLRHGFGTAFGMSHPLFHFGKDRTEIW